MKCKIRITGQIGGNFRLLSKLNNYGYEKGMFNSFLISYDSIREAKQAIRQANREFKQDEPRNSRLSMWRDASVLLYDCSTAEIIKNNL